MNIQEIIESGIIELYVMNALPEDEAAQVEALAAEHPEIRMEIAQAETALQQYAEAHAIAPRPELKDSILEKIKEETRSSPQNEGIQNPVSAQPKGPLSIQPPWTWLAAAASVIAIVLFFQNLSQKKALSDCNAENTQLVEKQKVVAQLEYKLDILRRADTKPIQLDGTGKTPNAKAIVYWNAKEKVTLLAIQDLPEHAKGMQYQLWAIVDGKPVDAGVFVNDKTLFQSMKGFEKASAFAVTLEQEGGSKEPTMENMAVIGTVL
jgi:anti-sigma-K factor RskA